MPAAPSRPPQAQKAGLGSGLLQVGIIRWQKGALAGARSVRERRPLPLCASIGACGRSQTPVQIHTGPAAYTRSWQPVSCWGMRGARPGITVLSKGVGAQGRGARQRTARGACTSIYRYSNFSTQQMYIRYLRVQRPACALAACLTPHSLHERLQSLTFSGGKRFTVSSSRRPAGAPHPPATTACAIKKHARERARARRRRQAALKN